MDLSVFNREGVVNVLSLVIGKRSQLERFGFDEFVGDAVHLVDFRCIRDRHNLRSETDDFAIFSMQFNVQCMALRPIHRPKSRNG